MLYPELKNTAGAQPAPMSNLKSTPRGSAPSLPTNPIPVPCNSCDTLVGDEAIGCDRCSGWFHPTVMCLGIPQDSIKEIVRLGGDGILFICLHCKVSCVQASPSRASTSNFAGSVDAIKQMSEMVLTLCATVKTLSLQMESILAQQQTPNPPSIPNDPPNVDNMRSIICDELREMRDRERRRDSIIIRGMPNLDDVQVTAKFKELTLFLINKEVNITPICINRERGVFRATLPNDNDRRELLSATNKF